MKTPIILFASAFAAASFFSSCSGHKHEEGEAHEHEHTDSAATEVASATGSSAPQFSVDAAFQQQLAGVFSSYISLKDGFVSSNATNVKVEAASMRQALDKTDMKLLSGPAHHDWMTYLEGMQASLKDIEASSDIEVQRQAFSKVSGELYKSIKAYGLGGTTAYYEFCPMAFNNQGGFWLSKEEKIRNPYFGDQMLTCGEVKEKL